MANPDRQDHQDLKGNPDRQDLKENPVHQDPKVNPDHQDPKVNPDRQDLKENPVHQDPKDLKDLKDPKANKGLSNPNVNKTNPVTVNPASTYRKIYWAGLALRYDSASQPRRIPSRNPRLVDWIIQRALPSTRSQAGYTGRSRTGFRRANLDGSQALETQKPRRRIGQ